MSQLNIFKGREKKEAGIKKAMDSAGEQWAEDAYGYLHLYAQYHSQFMIEEVREWTKKLPWPLDDPPSKRAWGGIIRRAKREGLVKHIGYGQVNNPKAHMANASIWESLIYKS